MAGKFGSASAFLLVAGYNLLAMKVKTLTHKDKSITEATHGLGDAYETHTPVGVKRTTITQGGGYFDTDTHSGHTALAGGLPTTPQSATRLVCFGFASEVGGPFVGCRGEYTHTYEVMGIIGELTKANAEYKVAGAHEPGEVVQPLATKTADWNTKTLGTPVDSGASSSAGGAGYLQVSACSGFTNFVGKIRDSADDSTYADLVTFADNVVAPFAERVEVAGTVDRYLSFDGNVTGSGSITAFAGFSRFDA